MRNLIPILLAIVVLCGCVERVTYSDYTPNQVNCVGDSVCYSFKTGKRINGRVIDRSNYYLLNYEYSYENGVKNGPSVELTAIGLGIAYEKGIYLNGKKHGQFIIEPAVELNGVIDTLITTYFHGEKKGLQKTFNIFKGKIETTVID